ncbi:DUF2437 domain-containing protein [Rhodococcus hoagii]|nr:DUF2437 domain-containing protein [Prescottella equi]
MKWVTYDAGHGPRTGILDNDTVRGLRAGVTLMSLLDGSLDEAAESAKRTPDEVRPLDEVRLLAPLPRPASVRDGLCFLDHLRGARRAYGAPDDELAPVWYQTPAFYFSNAGAIYGPHDEVPIAPGSQMFDFELEVGAVIGRAGRDLHPDNAESHIVGYTLFNDWSARDLQLRDMSQGIGMGKAKDTAITLGPALVTVDEFEDYRRDGRIAIELTAAVNDVEVARGTLDQMDWSFGELISYISRGVNLSPGDVIGSGTVPGGCLLEHVDTPVLEYAKWLQPGDVVTLSGEGIGQIRQTVGPRSDIIPLSSGF